MKFKKLNWYKAINLNATVISVAKNKDEPKFNSLNTRNPNANSEFRIITPFTKIPPTRVCFTNAGVNSYGARIHKVRKNAI